MFLNIRTIPFKVTKERSGRAGVLYNLDNDLAKLFYRISCGFVVSVVIVCMINLLDLGREYKL